MTIGEPAILALLHQAMSRDLASEREGVACNGC